MPDIHDAALEWAQKNANDPRAQDIMAKAWAAKNPQDPRSQAILERFKPADNGTPSGNQRIATIGDSKFAQKPSDRDLEGPIGDRQAMMRFGADPEVQKATVGAFPAIGGAVGGTVGGFPGAIAGAATGSMAKNIIQNPQQPKMQDIADIGKETALYGAVPEAVGAVGKGLGTAGDYLMQRAVGLKKFIPGVGKTLAEEGLVGTQDMMAKQAASGLAKRGQQIGSLAESVPEVSSDLPAQKLVEKAQRLVQSDGYIHPESQVEYDYLMKLAEEAAARGSETGTVSGKIALEARMAAGRQARKAGAYRLTTPSEGVKASGLSTEQGGWSQALKEAYSQANPANPEELAAADKAYSALSGAYETLSTPKSLPKSVISYTAGPAAGAGLGYMVGGGKGAAAGAMLGTPLASSVAGRGAIYGGRALESIAPNTIRTLADLIGNRNQQ